MATTFGQKLQEFAEQLGVCFRQHTAAHCKIVTLANTYDVYYGRRGYSVIPKTGLATFRTGTILDVIKYIRQCEEYVTAGIAGEAKPAVAETPLAVVKPTSREWSTEFVEKYNRFPHAIDYADAGYGTGSQCDCTNMSECVLRDAFNRQHCDRNCYTQQLKDYIVMSTTKRAVSKQEDNRPTTAEALLSKIRTMMTDADCDTICIPLWAEKLLLQGANLGEVRRAMRWQAGSWRPQSIYSLRCVWETKDLVVT